jgi:acyl-[acyl-carrier-protein]-phospholipid O-acyltransferase/long-chain-fatty-acid--[acyl-carrier-protein] ligase
MILHHNFLDNAKKFPKKIAVIEQATGKEVSYDKLLISALIFKDIFAKYHSQHIGIMIPPSPGAIVAILGVIFAGKTPVFLNYSTGAIQNSLFAQKKCAFRTIITSRKLLEKLKVEPLHDMVFMEDLAEKISFLQKIKAMILSKLPVDSLKKMLPVSHPDDNIVILFTSGSEKEPRAVQLSHKNIAHNIISIREIFHLDEHDVFITNLPYFHVFGLTVNLWIPLVLGGQIITTPNPLDYRTIVEGVRGHGVTLFVATPTFHYGYLQKAQPGDFDRVRLIISGADKMPNHILEEYQNKHNKVVYEGYGTTETSPIISVNLPGRARKDSIGKPLPGVQIKIVNFDTGDEVQRGEEGKILVKGDLVMKGYYNDIEETSYRKRDGWYDTGDMGVQDDDGYLYHRGRLRRFVKIGGEMVSLVKVEEEVINLLPHDVICCVVAVPDPIRGSEIVTVLTSYDINQKELRKKLARVLPPVATPKIFRVLEEVPMHSNGKVNFRAVEEICRNMTLEEI